MKYFFCALSVFIFFSSCNSANTKRSNENYNDSVNKSSAALFKKAIDGPVITATNDEINNNLYHNIGLKFSIRFPEKWEFIKGESPIIINNMDTKSVKRFYIRLINNAIFLNGINNLTKSDLNTLKLYETNETQKLNYTVKNLYYEKTSIGNIPALYKYSVLTGKLEFGESKNIENVEMLTLTYILNTERKATIAISYSMPIQLFNKNEKKRFTTVLKSFKFDD